MFAYEPAAFVVAVLVAFNTPVYGGVELFYAEVGPGFVCDGGVFAGVAEPQVGGIYDDADPVVEVAPGLGV